MAYTDSALIEQQLGRTLTADETALLTVLLPAIKLWIDHKLDTTFDQATASTRLYDADGPTIDIDPCTTVTKIESIDNELESTNEFPVNEYVLEPVNATVKTQIRFRWSTAYKGIANIRVTAKFSEYDDGVPEDIQMIATRLAVSIITENAIASESGTIQSETIEGHAVTYKNPNQIINKVGFEDPAVNTVLSLRKRPIVG